MLGRTHARVGLALTAVVAGHSDAVLPLLALGMVAAQGPDVDHEGSLIGRVFFFWPARHRMRGPYFEHGRWTPWGTWWHRGPTHSLEAALLVGLVALLLSLWCWPEHALLIAGVVWLCYGSHLVADLVNRSPIMILASRHLYIRLPHRLTLPQSNRLEQFGERTLRAACTIVAVCLAGPPLLQAGLRLLTNSV